MPSNLLRHADLMKLRPQRQDMRDQVAVVAIAALDHVTQQHVLKIRSVEPSAVGRKMGMKNLFPQTLDLGDLVQIPQDTAGLATNDAGPRPVRRDEDIKTNRYAVIPRERFLGSMRNCRWSEPRTVRVAPPKRRRLSGKNEQRPRSVLRERPLSSASKRRIS